MLLCLNYMINLHDEQKELDAMGYDKLSESTVVDPKYTT